MTEPNFDEYPEIHCYNCDAMLGIAEEEPKEPPFCNSCASQTTGCPACPAVQKCYEVGMHAMMFELNECPDHKED